ncbi:MAG: discoidin domain-containing protein [Verrucomicrobiales bacterium]
MIPSFSRLSLALLSTLLLSLNPVRAQILDKQELLDSQTFWDNQDWDWFKANIPFFECPDPEITTTWYYRWELLTKHLTYGSPTSGYSFTEFIDRPFWSGAYGAISCPAGHQLYEARWLRDPNIARDYARYWLRTPGAQPRNYSTWLADSIWAVHEVHRDDAFITDLLPDLVGNFEAWEKRQFVPEEGLFWQIGHDDGMEFNIASRQTSDILRGAQSFRPSFNTYMWADARAIARIAGLANEPNIATQYEARAGALKERLQASLWDPQREFFLIRFKNDEHNEKDFPGKPVKAGSLIYETGPFAGRPHGREEIGYVPWQFNLPDPGYEAAWKFLMDPDYFYADRGPTTVERHDPMFLLQRSCCWWSGQSWPYATTQTLKAMANLLQNYEQQIVTRADYLELLSIYSLSHRKNDIPYLAEALHPDTGSFEGHDAYNHSEHYFHSGFNDLIITGLAGLKPRADDTVEIDPLAPADWPWFALDDIPYHGHNLSIFWDKDGTRYGKGQGLQLLVDGKTVATSPELQSLTVKLPDLPLPSTPGKRSVNYLVTNDGDYFPRLTATFSSQRTPLAKVNDGNYWYHIDPPNRWTTEDSPNSSDTIEADFGTLRTIDTVKLYFLDDGERITAPESFTLEAWNGSAWDSISGQTRAPVQPTGRRANVIRFPAQPVQKLRVAFTHADGNRTGLTEWEVWGKLEGDFVPAPPPAGNLALNISGEGFPKASASFHDIYGGIPRLANDGKTNYQPNPVNRWTSYGSPNSTDWLEIDFGKATTMARVELCLYDDRGGVQPPETFSIQSWDGEVWNTVADQFPSPETPVGSAINTITFPQITTPKLRVTFTHQHKARSGVTEILVWEK